MAPFKYRAFTIYWLARFLWGVATQMQITAMGWQVYDNARIHGASISEGALLIGFIGLAQFVPLATLALFGGQVADQYNRRNILLVGLVIKFALAMALVFGAYMQIYHHAFEGVSGITWLIMGIAMLTGALNAFMPAAATAMAPNLVDKAILPQSIAMMSLGFQFSVIAGPALGGILYGFSPLVVYGTAACAYLIATILVSSVPAPPQAPFRPGPMLTLIAEGIAYVRRNPIVLGAISLDLGVVWFAGAMALLPVFARDILHAGPAANGMLRSSFACGAALVAFILAVKPIARHAGYWMFFGTSLFAVASIGFALSKIIFLSVLCLAFAGMGDMISVYVRASLVQLATPDAMRGRISALSFLFISASNELGDFQSGVAGRIFGPVISVVGGGIIALGVAFGWTKLFPELLACDSFSDAEAYAVLPESAEAKG